MRPIEINITIKKKFGDLIDEELKNSDSAISLAKLAIEDLDSISSDANQKNAIKDIVTDFKSFILTEPTEHEALIKKWDLIDVDLFSAHGVDKNGKKTQRKTNSFGISILQALDFDKFRKVYATEIANIINIKTCPYCNAMLTIVLPKTKKENARFQLDHYYPKSKFPLLSICFFNLIPSCGHCNQYKGTGTPKLGYDFHLYAKETPKEGFKFKIPDADVAKYWLNHKIDDVKIEFIPDRDSDKKYVKNHNDRYRIDRIYNTQKDIAEEIFWKASVYNESRITELISILKISESEIRRMILSNYISKEEIHKRPMAKFTQDIARQMKLIK